MKFEEIKIETNSFQNLPGKLQFIDYLNATPGIFSFAIQQPPHVRTIVCDNSEYRISFPWCIFFPVIYIDEAELEENNINFIADSLALAFSNCKVGKKSKKKLYYANLPNIEDYDVCMGGEFSRENSSPKTCCFEIIQDFWNIPFNTLEGGNIIYHYDVIDKRVIDLDTWQEKTIKNPNFATNVRWYKNIYSKDFNEMLRYI